MEETGSNRPDAIVAEIVQQSLGGNIGSGEAKTDEARKHEALMYEDLLRLGVFSKDAIDFHNLPSAVSFQAVGRRVVFYITSLIHDGIYSMIEIAVVNCPLSLNDLPDYLNNFDNLLKVLIAVDKCQRVENIPSSYHRSTLDTPTLQAYIGKKKDQTTTKGTCIF
jgi:hypothetical protein